MEYGFSSVCSRALAASTVYVCMQCALAIDMRCATVDQAFRNAIAAAQLAVITITNTAAALAVAVAAHDQEAAFLLLTNISRHSTG